MTNGHAAFVSSLCTERCMSAPQPSGEVGVYRDNDVSTIALIVAHGAPAADANPMAKVMELMDECAAKVKADGVAEAKAYKKYFVGRDDTSKNTQFEIKTFSSEMERLEATTGGKTAIFAASTSKFE